MNTIPVRSGEPVHIPPPDKPSPPNPVNVPALPLNHLIELHREMHLHLDRIKAEERQPEALKMSDSKTAVAVTDRIYFGPVPAGSVWIIKRAAMLSNSAGNPTGKLYVTSQKPASTSPPDADVQDVLTAAKSGVMTSAQEVWCAYSQYICMEWVTVAIGDIITANMQIVAKDWDVFVKGLK